MPEDDLDRELQSHLDLEAEELGDRHAARRAFGNLTAVREAIHDMSRWRLVDQLWQDLRYGLRLLLRSPAFSVVAVLTLALGIGANVAIFTVVNSVLLRPLPFPEPERLVRIWETMPSSDVHRNVVNPQNFADWSDYTHSFEAMAAISGMPANVTGEGDPVALDGMQVTPRFFAVLKVAPFMGRAFTDEDGIPGRGDKVILSYSLWRTHYGGDSHILGRTITVNGTPVTVVGVLPRDFHFPGSQADVWSPMAIDRHEKRGGRYLTTVARLKAGVSLRQAQADLEAAASQTARERPEMNRDWSAEAVPFLPDITSNVRLPLLVLLGAVGLVLLIACANVTNLLLMRANGRQREIALRAALGAGRRRILQQMLSESLLLAAAGCAAGLAVGYWGLRGLLALVPASVPLPRMESIRLDSGMFLFAAGVALWTAILFGLLPALQVSSPRLQTTLQAGSPRAGTGGSRVMRRGLVVAEVALALLLLVGAGLLLRSFQKLISVNPGFAPERLLTMHIFTSPAKYSDDRKRAQYVDSVLAEMRRVPGVEAAGSTHFLPLSGFISGSCFARAPGPEPDVSSPSSEFLIVTAGYFEALREPVLRGRAFNPSDTFGTPSVLVVNQAFAQRYFPNEDPIGKSLNVCWTVPNPVRIVGVVADARQKNLQGPPQPTIFLDNSQAPMYFARLIARTRSDPRQMARAIEAAVHRVDPGQAIASVQTMEDVFSDSVSRPRFQLTLLLMFAGMAVLLASIGVYGVVSYSVSQRTREIGIRVALGAQARDVWGLVLREGLLLGALGVALGLAGAVAFTNALRSLLFEVKPTDPLTLTAVAALLLTVTAAAALAPARRAVKVDPMVALREE